MKNYQCSQAVIGQLCIVSYRWLDNSIMSTIIILVSCNCNAIVLLKSCYYYAIVMPVSCDMPVAFHCHYPCFQNVIILSQSYGSNLMQLSVWKSVCVCVCVCMRLWVCFNANTLHYYVLRVLRYTIDGVSVFYFRFTIHLDRPRYGGCVPVFVYWKK